MPECWAPKRPKQLSKWGLSQLDKWEDYDLKKARKLVKEGVVV